jgi:hypothetical protein
MLRSAGETETKQENIQVWLELDEAAPGFQLLTEEEIYHSDVCVCSFVSTTYTTFSIYFFQSFFLRFFVLH